MTSPQCQQVPAGWVSNLIMGAQFKVFEKIFRGVGLSERLRGALLGCAEQSPFEDQDVHLSQNILEVRTLLMYEYKGTRGDPGGMCQEGLLASSVPLYSPEVTLCTVRSVAVPLFRE